MSNAVSYSIALAAGAAALMVVITNRPSRRPGNLAPIQVVTALGAWALIVVNAVLVGVACASGFAPLGIPPAATIFCAAIMFAYGTRDRRSTRAVPAPFDVAVAEIRTLLGPANALGFNDIDAVLVDRGPRIGVAVPAPGRVVVLVHESMVAWIDRHVRGRAGAATIGSFVRFAVLHELGHILNGDHRTYRFARSVLIAHLSWLLSLIAVPWAVANATIPSVATLLVANAFVCAFAAFQSLIARRFIAERERLADWRAIQCLSPEDASRLLRRSATRRNGRRAPTELEKLMLDLKAQQGEANGVAAFAAVIRLLWPEGDSIRRRTEALAGGRAGAPARPVRWAALTAVQCGVLGTAVAMAILLLAGSMQMATIVPTFMIVMAWFGGGPGTYCLLRADPARLSLDARTRTRHRLVTGVVFILTFLAAALATDCLAFALRIPSWSPGAALITGAMSSPVVMVGCSWLSDLLTDPLGGTGFHRAPRERWAFAVPLVCATFFVLGPVNVVVSRAFGLRGFTQGSWVAVMLCSVGMYVLSTVMARSPRAAVRAAAPIAVLQTSPPVFGYRLFWRELFVDLTRCTVARSGVIAAAFQTAALFPLVLAFAFAMGRYQQIAGFPSAFTVFFLLSLAFFILIILVPDRYGTLHPRLLRLIDRDALELFLALLESARHADRSAYERLRERLARWLPHDGQVMFFLLPDRRNVWMLPALWAFIRVARATGAVHAIHRARPQIEAALREIITNDAVPAAPRQPPSLLYTSLAATIADEAWLADRFPVERMVDRVCALLNEQLCAENVNLIADVVNATRLLQARRRAAPDQAMIRRFVQRSTLLSRPTGRQSLVELCDLAELLGDARERERLAPIVRSRMWEILQMNPRQEVLALLDCYLAAVRLGEGDSPLTSAAAALVTEMTLRTANELTAMQRLAA